MSRRRLLIILVMVIATALFVLPGVAFSKGGGTPNPPGTNPPCTSDGHQTNPPSGLNKKCPTPQQTGTA